MFNMSVIEAFEIIAKESTTPGQSGLQVFKTRAIYGRKMRLLWQHGNITK